MQTTLLLAKVIGSFLLVMGLSLAFNIKHMKKILTDLSKDQGLLFFSGILMMIVGLLIVINHNIWITPLTVVISLMGWLTLLHGVARIALTQRIAHMLANMAKNNGVLYFSLAFVLIVGAYLAYFGFYSVPSTGWFS